MPVQECLCHSTANATESDCSITNITQPPTPADTKSVLKTVLCNPTLFDNELTAVEAGGEVVGWQNSLDPADDKSKSSVIAGCCTTGGSTTFSFSQEARKRRSVITTGIRGNRRIEHLHLIVGAMIGETETNPR